jgi:hypothetical protein
VINYSVTTTGGCVIQLEQLQLLPNNTVSAASSTPTLCINTALTAITHTTTGATGIGTGLPSGVTAAASNTITISGTPTAAGTTTAFHWFVEQLMLQELLQSIQHLLVELLQEVQQFVLELIALL